MRGQFVSELIKEVRGPRNGTDEIISSNPFTEYISGVIIPRGYRSIDRPPDAVDIRSGSDDGYTDDGENESEAPFSVPSELDAQMKPKSFGISFLVAGKAPILSICISFARYQRIVNNCINAADEDNVSNRKWSWKRHPHAYIKNITVGAVETGNVVIYSGEDGQILLNIRGMPQEDSGTFVIIGLINDLKIPGNMPSELAQVSLFQPSIRVKITGDGDLIAPRTMPQSELDYLYYDRPVLARGHMCSAIWRAEDYSDKIDEELGWPECNFSGEVHEFTQCDVRSEFVPLHPSPAPDFEWDRSKSNVAPVCSAYSLSELWDAEGIEQLLAPIASAYRSWIRKNEADLEAGRYRSVPPISSEIIKRQKEGLERIQSGIECLKENEGARLAFCFANRVLWLQNLWKKGYSIRECTDEDIRDSERDFIWRPFQLAFFLASLESLYSQDSAYRDTLDLLWVPTGGGKTEAYLGMMAFTIALRRLQSVAGKIPSNFASTGAGVSIITRYTLRLLTVQQFRRTLLMITAAEYLRVQIHEGRHGWRPEKCPFTDSWLYGETRFSVGMWVGGAVSPNDLRRDFGAIQALKRNPESGDPAQIVKCPVCGVWLSIPSAGLPEGKNRIHLIIKSECIGTLKSSLTETKLPNRIAEIRVLDSDLPYPYSCLEIETSSSQRISAKDFDADLRGLEESGQFSVVSFRASRPGYFPIPKEQGRAAEDKYSGFEIHCPNPGCDLNNIEIWKEGVPVPFSESNETIGTSGLFVQSVHGAFSKRTMMPIPAYTVDEQIYHRCPTVVISTADKIARLAYEPRAGSMFGAVRRYNRYYGYLRGSEEEKAYHPHDDRDLPKQAFSAGTTVDVKPFLPPDLILQDELHLMDGPLGSMFGLYELVVDGLIKHAGGRPKYIASSATVKRAEDQVAQLFQRKTFQFPPNGLEYSDSFFVRMPGLDSAWDESKPGRIYLGVYAPGMGPLTPNVRLWARLLKTGDDLRNDPDIRYFWTPVGYFNSLRELGGTSSLYREDIVERLDHISENPRRIHPDRMEELSSRINSTDIPQLLEDLEEGNKRLYSLNPDAILTTSMFGTGVDIPHLSLMLVNGQPKTTSQYIQATGRVGRRHGALVAVFYKAGRARDLSHYELFAEYHSRINLSVEPASVSPLSRGCIERAAGPAMVAFLRNMRDATENWAPNNGHIVQTANAKRDFQEFIRICFEGRQADNIISFMQSQYDMWKDFSDKVYPEVLDFWEDTQHHIAKHHVVLGDPAHEWMKNIGTVFKNAPNSLRDVEETTAFEV